MAEQRIVDWDGLVYYDSKIKSYISDKLEECIKFMGEVSSISTLPDPSYNTLNYLFKITSPFEVSLSNGDFVSVARGKAFGANTLVCVTDYDSVYLYSIVLEPSSNGGLNIDLSNYYTKSEIDKKLLDIENKATIDVSILEGFVSEDEWSQRVNDFANKSELANKANSDHKHSLSDILDYKAPTIPSKVSELDNDLGYISSIPDNYVTQDDLSKYSKFSGSYNDLTDKPTIPSIDGLASEQYVDGVVANLVTKEQLSTKADVVVFTENMVVGTPFGEFSAGDSLQGMTISQILTKLLSLTVHNVPEVDGELSETVENIATNKIPMYSINPDGELIESTYDEVQIIPESESISAPTKNGFYHIVNEAGDVLESGYQHLSCINPDAPYTIAFTKDIDYHTDVTVQVWDVGESAWVEVSLPLSKDYVVFADIFGDTPDNVFPGVDLDNFTVWFSEDSGSTGASYRFIINK